MKGKEAMNTATKDGLAVHLNETTASACADGTLDEPVGLPVVGALAALSLLAAAGALCFGLWKLASWLLG